MKGYEELVITVAHPAYTALRDFFGSHGYIRDDELNRPGAYQIVGDRIKVWPAWESEILTIDFFGDNIETITLGSESITTYTLRENRLHAEDGIIDSNQYVVHPAHGIGQFIGFVKRRFGDGWAEFIQLGYANNDALFVQAVKADMLMPYFGASHPRLSRLHSPAWARTKRRIAEDLLQIARDLLTVQANRQVITRPAWPHSTEWEKILESSFPHTLTTDQVKATDEIFSDLSSKGEPMDRLLTGDVGYGKTEVAIRAAAQVLAGGGQVIVIAPTTVLTEQHYDVWKQRLSALPVRVTRISRLTKITAAEKERINSGYYDVVIGTHRLFSQSWVFPRLGLVVVDEEQRFGVKQKEFFKQLRYMADVLSLTATPIPRTLYMSLSGLRAMSTIRTAPGERKGVVTKVTAYKNETICDAIVHEKKRKGQIYYVHNRVRTLPGVVSRLRVVLDGKLKLTRDTTADPATHLRYATAHGQMEATQLAPILHTFFNGEIDMLISTAIVEHGLDNPNANTMIVERAEDFGLADLYQLRGRVGRRNRQAYALLLIGNTELKRATPLPKAAEARLETMADTEKLGSGWAIALRDLEIRGAGSLIGARQHGNLEAIGLVLYSRMLSRLVERLKTMSSSDNLIADTLAVWES